MYIHTVAIRLPSPTLPAFLRPSASCAACTGPGPRQPMLMTAPREQDTAQILNTKTEKKKKELSVPPSHTKSEKGGRPKRSRPFQPRISENGFLEMIDLSTVTGERGNREGAAGRLSIRCRTKMRCQNLTLTGRLQIGAVVLPLTEMASAVPPFFRRQPTRRRHCSAGR